MTCAGCFLKCIATGCECLCHIEYKLLKLPLQTVAHYFEHGKATSVCGKSEIGMTSKVFTPKEETPTCQSCKVIINMRERRLKANESRHT